MKKILITGAGGFIGSHLTEFCLKKGLSVRAFVHYNSRNSWGWLEEIKKQKDFEVVTGDIRDFDSVAKAAKGCQSVFHLAALIGIPYSYESPLAYIRTNIEGTYNVLQAAKVNNFQNVLITSTSETYGTAQYVPIDERHPLVGQSPYSASKIGADQLAISYYRSFKLPVKIVRPFNTYGPRQSARAIIPTIISQISAGQKQIKLGNLSPSRDLTYVKDTVAGFWAIYENNELRGETVNVGTGTEITIGELALRIAHFMKKKIKIIKDDCRVRAKSSEVERLLCDNFKILDKTDWSPRYDLDRGLKETINWVKKHSSIYKSEIYNV